MISYLRRVEPPTTTASPSVFHCRLQRVEEGASEDYASAECMIPEDAWQPVEKRWCSPDPATFDPGRDLALLEIGQRSCVELLRAAQGGQRERLEGAKDQLLSRLLTDVSHEGPLTCTGVNRYPGGLATVTIDEAVGRRIGLHLDSWDGAPAYRRRESSNRICVNLGPGKRWLLLAPLPIDELAVEYARRNGIALHEVNAKAVASWYVQHEDLKIEVIEIPPGFAYVAATENYLHDASTAKSRLPCFTVTWRGRLRPL